MRIVVGLGNPGRRYAGTRHNIGFAVTDTLAQRWRLSFGPPRHRVRMAQGLICDVPTLLVEPQLYMNLSGAALAGLDEPIRAEQLIVVHDDLDLVCGCLRVKRGGGTGGHQGLSSIVERYGNGFTRVRLGLGRPPRGMDVVDYVLAPFDADQEDVISAAVARAADAVECVLAAGETAAMNVYNMRADRRPAAATAETGRK